jgi:hypothetical protein
MNKCAKSRAVSGDSDRSIRILLAVTNNPSRFSHAQACGGVAAAVAGAVETSVADPGVYPGSQILIFTHPGSRIPDPKTATKERGEKNFIVITLYVATNFTKL